MRTHLRIPNSLYVHTALVNLNLGHPHAVKCFVYTSKVSAKAHPPRIVRRTHKMLYYDYDAYAASRYSDAYVHASYPPPLSMLGDVGDGFCFDTNSIHQGSLGGSRQRDSLVLEFHDKHKVAAYAQSGAPASSACKSVF